MTKDAEKLLTALRAGNVVNAGGILMTSDGQFLGLTLTGFYWAVCELGKIGYCISRIDAGGRPEWELK